MAHLEGENFNPDPSGKFSKERISNLIINGSGSRWRDNVGNGSDFWDNGLVNAVSAVVLPAAVFGPLPVAIIGALSHNETLRNWGLVGVACEVAAYLALGRIVSAGWLGESPNNGCSVNSSNCPYKFFNDFDK